jgi:hypothetical protein
MTDATSTDPSQVLSGGVVRTSGTVVRAGGEFRVLSVLRTGSEAIQLIIEHVAREGPCPICGGGELGGEGAADDPAEGPAGVRPDRGVVVGRAPTPVR